MNKFRQLFSMQFFQLEFVEWFYNEISNEMTHALEQSSLQQLNYVFEQVLHHLNGGKFWRRWYILGLRQK